MIGEVLNRERSDRKFLLALLKSSLRRRTDSSERLDGEESFAVLALGLCNLWPGPVARQR